VDLHPVGTGRTATLGQGQPHPPPAVVSGPQQRDFSDGAQQLSCSLGAQHAVGEDEVTSARTGAGANGIPVARGACTGWCESVDTDRSFEANVFPG
jgi:hypothetical protein